ncbi:MAG TPA: beta-ketoacyl synthase chain length factor [Pseudomonas sp.]|nr:beta-ketoacyl synthase chain length factor [Pseudomonas sp.]
MIQFNIDQWRAWAPGIESVEDWARWSAMPWQPPQSEAQPDVSFLPALQRRRLGRLARMAFSVAWPLAEGQPPLPLVFASRHGETPRTLALLGDLARQEPLSPTQFSLSVHNAIIGLWSILRGDTSEMTALAAEGDGLEHGLLEAALLLADGAPAVLLVVAEDMPPAAYAPWIDDVPFPYAVGLRLTPGHDWQLELSQGETGETAKWPHALGLLRTLSRQQDHCLHHWKNRTWTLRHPA